MAICAYFYDKVTNKIIGRNIHQVKDVDNPGRLKYEDVDLTECWEDIRTGNKWPDILERVTDHDPDNLGLIYADDIPYGYNEYKPSLVEGTTRLERRPYICLKIKQSPNVIKSEERDRYRLHDVDTEGEVTLDMEVQVKTTQSDIEKHDKDKNVNDIDGEFAAECTHGRITPRNGIINVVNGKASFKWHLPDTNSKELARCYVKDSKGEVLISKSLRVNCC